MRAAIVGGGGFVGGHVADVLAENGHDVLLVDSEFTARKQHALHKADIRQVESLRKPFDGADVVFHLAAVSNTGSALRDPVTASAINVTGTWKVLKAAADAGVGKVVVAGSTLISAVLEPIPMAWPHGVDLPATATDEMSGVMLVPTHPYVSSKVATEQAAMDAREAFGLETVVLRYGIQYGPRMTPGVLFHTMIQRGLNDKPLTVDGDGSAWRQYMHVEDLALAHLAVLENWEAAKDETFNVCPHDKVTVLRVAEIIAKTFGVPIEHGPPRSGDIDVQFCLASKAQQRLGWQCGWSLEDGIAQTIDWYRRNG